jgi:hypothetical protein
MRLKLDVTGIKEIDTLLKQMPLKLSDRVLQNASARAAKPLVEKEKLLAPEGPTGNLVDSIGVVRGSFNQLGRGQRLVGEVSVGPRRRGRYKGHAGHLVEYGTKKRTTKGRGRVKVPSNRGIMPKKPFVKPAFQATRNHVLQIYNQEVAKVLLSTMRRTVKK